MSTQTLQKWNKVKLFELGSVDRGRSRHRPRNDASLYGGTYPFVQTGDVKSANFYITSYSQTYNDKGLAQSKIWDPGTLCITIAANIGESAILKIPACFPDSIVGFRSYKGISDVRFVKYFLDFLKNQFQAISKGTTQDNLSLDKLLSIDLNVPNYLTQTHIADFLIAYDDLIENNTRRIQILEQMAQAIYTEWFVNFRFPGSTYAKATADRHEKAKSRSELSSATGIKMIDSGTEFGKIPEGWAVKGLDEDFEIVLGGTPSRANSEYWNGNVPWINSGETNHLRVITPSEFITKKGLDNSAAKLMPKRTTVLAITGATLGQVSLLEIECSANQSVVGIYDKNAIYNEYLYLFISDKIDDIISKSGGSAQQHINKKIVEEYQILVPPKKEIDELNKVIKPIFNLLSGLLFSNQNLRQARDLLLPKLVTGEIKV